MVAGPAPRQDDAARASQSSNVGGLDKDFGHDVSLRLA
jgi:hypothetical protein